MRAKDFLIESAKKCPLATQDININIKNRQKAINEQGYGPLNPLDPNEKFWAKKAQMWQLDNVDEAKKSLCGNCAAFDKSEEMLKCIAQGIGSEDDPTSTIEAGDLGYCKFLKFKCASLRTCDAWVVGGPITENQTSNDKINEFLDFVKEYLELDQLPEINFLQNSLDSTFGHYTNGKIEVVIAGRHQNDVFRTLAHELVHYKQELDGRINDKSGETGSSEENEANSEAGIIMRHYNHSKEDALEENFADGNKQITFQVTKGRNSFSTQMTVNEEPAGIYQYDANTGRSIAEIYPEFRSQGLGKILVLNAIYTAAQLGMNFQEDESRTAAYDNVLDSLSSNGYIVDDDGYWYVTGEGEQFLNTLLNENFADGKNPQDKGDSRRHGIPKGVTIAQLKKIRSSDTASPRKKQLAHWQINMRQGKKK